MTRARASFTRQTAEARKRLLIDATIACLQRRGAGGLTVRAIAAEAGVSPGLLAHHFAGIEDLVDATYRDIAARVAAALDHAAGATPLARLTGFLTASFRPPVMDSALFAAWIAFWDLGRRSPVLAATHRALYLDHRRRVEALLEDCGVAPERLRRAAIAAAALVDGLWLELCIDPSAFSADEAAAIVESWVPALLQGDG